MATQSTNTHVLPDPVEPTANEQFSAPRALHFPSSDDPPPLQSVHASSFSAVLQEVQLVPATRHYFAGVTGEAYPLNEERLR